MQVKNIEVGSLNTNCYLLYNQEDNKAVVIDPGGDGEKIFEKINELKLEIDSIINTHGHYDHILANDFLSKQFNKPIYINEKDLPLLNHQRLHFFGEEEKSLEFKFLSEGDILDIDHSKIKVIETPGHTPGGITLSANHYLFVGDLIFQGSVGRTDLPGGSFQQLQESLYKITEFSEDTIIYPGHGPSTTLGRELMANPYLQNLERKD